MLRIDGVHSCHRSVSLITSQTRSGGTVMSVVTRNSLMGSLKREFPQDAALREIAQLRTC